MRQPLLLRASPQKHKVWPNLSRRIGQSSIFLGQASRESRKSKRLSAAAQEMCGRVQNVPGPYCSETCIAIALHSQLSSSDTQLPDQARLCSHFLQVVVETISGGLHWEKKTHLKSKTEYIKNSYIFLLNKMMILY